MWQSAKAKKKKNFRINPSEQLWDELELHLESRLYGPTPVPLWQSVAEVYVQSGFKMSGKSCLKVWKLFNQFLSEIFLWYMITKVLHSNPAEFTQSPTSPSVQTLKNVFYLLPHLLLILSCAPLPVSCAVVCSLGSWGPNFKLRGRKSVPAGFICCGEALLMPHLLHSFIHILSTH